MAKEEEDFDLDDELDLDDPFADDDDPFADDDDPFADDDDPFADDDDPFSPPKKNTKGKAKKPMAFSDEYLAAKANLVFLTAPRHSDAFSSLGQTVESRYPASRVAKSASELAQVLKALAAAPQAA